MKSTKRANWLTVLLALALLMVAVPALAQVGGYDLSWFTVDSGGGRSDGGGYTLTGTIGQADAGVLGGGRYSLAGGYWGGSAAAQYAIYLPVVLRN